MSGSSGGGGGGGGGPFDSGTLGSATSFEDEPPLLEELGINFDHIRNKTLDVLNPRRPITDEILEDNDLAGPLVFCMMLGFALMLTGKVHFGYIYGFGMIGCILIFTIVNLLNEHGIDMSRTMSILGYCLLPIVALAGFNVIIDLRGAFGASFAVLAIAWCTVTSTRFFEQALDMREQRYLIAYPIVLFYSCFAMITVF